jgi:hypothetical protein
MGFYITEVVDPQLNGFSLFHLEINNSHVGLFLALCRCYSHPLF